ncbi:DoxX family membrane protein [Pseudonocardia benzenivorans]|jgi:putative oxidoreductase|uniref:DoxX family protein n=2 Tax=Pseudonocardia TaxID=1847 RepID=F4CWZ3_PSEUX|nr:DoxX family protein [Pseudonocardia dioxanivorans]AEA24248.1 DoxX family protein [Pseudonocardia dioxanivorans CB1190]GJF07302.1 hypothetical protein PSD17_62490 [Pseudonocardia sp. D17]
MPRTLPDWMRDWSRDALILAARLIVSFVMLAHVWQTFVQTGFASTTVVFTKFGIPLAIVATAFTLVVELTGSILLALGVLVRTAAAGFTFVMGGAIVFVHAKHGVFVTNGGWELVGMIIATVLGIAAFGPGRLSLSHVIAGWRARAAETRAQRRAVVVSVADSGRPAAPAMAGGPRPEQVARAAELARSAQAEPVTDVRGFPMLSERFVPMGTPASGAGRSTAAEPQESAPADGAPAWTAGEFGEGANAADGSGPRYVPTWTEPEPHLFSTR